MSMDPKEADDIANFDLEVHAPLITSQDFAYEITGTSHTNVTENNSFEMDLLMDVFLDSEQIKMKSQGLSEDSIRLVPAPENEKVGRYMEDTRISFKTHRRRLYSRLWREYPCQLCVWMNCDNKYSPGSFWRIYSCVGSLILLKPSLTLKLIHCYARLLSK